MRGDDGFYPLMTLGLRTGRQLRVVDAMLVVVAFAVPLGTYHHYRVRPLSSGAYLEFRPDKVPPLAELTSSDMTREAISYLTFSRPIDADEFWRGTTLDYGSPVSDEMPPGKTLWIRCDMGRPPVDCEVVNSLFRAVNRRYYRRDVVRQLGTANPYGQFLGKRERWCSDILDIQSSRTAMVAGLALVAVAAVRFLKIDFHPGRPSEVGPNC